MPTSTSSIVKALKVVFVFQRQTCLATKRICKTLSQRGQTTCTGLARPGVNYTNKTLKLFSKHCTQADSPCRQAFYVRHLVCCYMSFCQLLCKSNNGLKVKVCCRSCRHANLILHLRFRSTIVAPPSRNSKPLRMVTWRFRLPKAG